ncbi:MAG TPA: tRNA (guanosine(46)-N7)-methyltransferase TrmB [Prolixibacteraceae bacterium]|nr:tRNA (guanosine(46)-N7)-methyltransferase TrmB [Prolixibacteraceae bacterium]
MGKNKLSKFAEMQSFSNVLQVTFSQLEQYDHPMKGNWNRDFFHNQKPIVLELGCGKGEYTTGLAEAKPENNYIGIDIKGARMWKGAKYATDNQLFNVGFLRTHIEMVDRFFALGEVSEIWLTFPDPQMKKVRKRLTSTRFIELYRKFLKPGGIVHLKTDSRFQFLYTREMVLANGFHVVEELDDVYGNGSTDSILSIKTFYEKQWLARGITIKYISFIPHQNELIEPEVDIEEDTYRSFGRGALTVD